jgi:hypothetical protein
MRGSQASRRVAKSGIDHPPKGWRSLRSPAHKGKFIGRDCATKPHAELMRHSQREPEREAAGQYALCQCRQRPLARTPCHPLTRPRVPPIPLTRATAEGEDIPVTHHGARTTSALPAKADFRPAPYSTPTACKGVLRRRSLRIDGPISSVWRAIKPTAWAYRASARRAASPNRSRPASSCPIAPLSPLAGPHPSRE